MRGSKDRQAMIVIKDKDGKELLRTKDSVTIELDDDKKKNSKDEDVLVEKYWETAARFAEFHAKKWSPLSFNSALLACSEWYDGPFVFDMIQRYMATGDARQRVISYAIEMALEGNIPYTVTGPTAPRGHKGWRTYNEGMVNLAGTDNQFKRDCKVSAINIGTLSSYTKIDRLHPGYVYWSGWQKHAYAREFSLAITALMNIRHWFLESALRLDNAIAHTIRDLTLRHANWYLHAGLNDSDEQLAKHGDDDGDASAWLPFMTAHMSRGLIRYHRDAQDNSMNSEIESIVPKLCDVIWNRAYRELTENGVTKHGLYYQADGGGEKPAPDLSLFVMPMFAWSWAVTGRKHYRERAIKLIESGLNWAWMEGQKQFCQSYIWSREGLVWLGLAPDDGPRKVALK